MSVSSLSGTVPVASPPLVRTPDGEITAASVAAHPEDAMELSRLKDGNYAYPIVSAADRPAGIAEALTVLRHGGQDAAGTPTAQSEIEQ